MGWTELHAAGFNAWSQALLVPKSRLRKDRKPLRTFAEPEDLRKFTQVLGNVSKDIRDVESFLSYTLVTTTTSTKIYGTPSPEQRALHTPPKRALYRLIAQAGNGKVTILDHDGKLRMYGSPKKLLEGEEECAAVAVVSDIIQLVAYEVGFAALERSGRVWTWGDERYPQCLGREAPATSSAQLPQPVSDLEDLSTGEIVKIAANGYTLGAVTDGGDLYCWGGHPAQAPIIDGLNSIPNLVDIDGRGVADFGVGDSHIIALTEDDRVMVIGDNTNGQLGIEAERATAWTEAPLDLGAESTVMAVRAGPKNSFVIIENDWDVEELSESDEDDAP